MKTTSLKISVLISNSKQVRMFKSAIQISQYSTTTKLTHISTFILTPVNFSQLVVTLDTYAGTNFFGKFNSLFLYYKAAF
jgi:hypothetical protein